MDDYPIRSPAMIDWTPNPVTLQLRPISLYWYGICYAVGLAGAYLVMVRMAERFRQNPAILGNGLIVVGIAALAGGRLYHVIGDQVAGALRRRPDQDLPPAICRSRDLRRVHHRGDRGHRAGPLPQGLVLAVGGHRRPGHAVMQAAGRLGNFFNQELYGRDDPAVGRHVVGASTASPSIRARRSWQIRPTSSRSSCTSR